MNAADTMRESLKAEGRSEIEVAEAFVAWLREQKVTGTMLTDAEARVAALKGETEA